MTREEQLDWLCRLRSEIYVYMPKEWLIPMNDALDMAIQALSQEPRDAAIDREELLKAIDTWDKFGYTETGCFVREPKGDYVPYIHYDDVIKCIKGMPSVTQKPIECDDAISRDDAIKALQKVACYSAAIRARMIGAIEDLPSVTQKSGKWIKVKSGDKDFPESIVCSRCSNENSHLDFNENAEPIGKVFVTSKFCPNCGAKMVEPQESEDKE